MAFTEEERAELTAGAAEIIARYPRSRSALLPLLHLVQAKEGFVSTEGIAFCATQLGLSEADVTAVVSFYTMYKRQPVGEYHVCVCTNTLCAIMGGDVIHAELRSTWASTATSPRRTARSAWSAWSATRPATTPLS